MRQVILVLIWIAVSSDFSLGQSLPQEIKLCITKNCDSDYTFTTILRSNRLSFYFPKAYFSTFYNYGNHTLKIYTNGRMPKFIEAVGEYFGQSKNKKKIVSIIHLWCSENEFINDLSSDDRVSPLEILYKTYLTRHIFDKFKLNPPTRDWFSLSTYETYEININYLNYVETLNDTQLRDLHRRLRVTANRLLKKLNKKGLSLLGRPPEPTASSRSDRAKLASGA